MTYGPEFHSNHAPPTRITEWEICKSSEMGSLWPASRPARNGTTRHPMV